MPTLSASLVQRTHGLLVNLSEFSSNEALRNVFSDSRLAQWKHNVPEANTCSQRVSYVIEKFSCAWNNKMDNGLLLLLQVLYERTGNTELHTIWNIITKEILNNEIIDLKTQIAKTTEHQNSGWTSPTEASSTIASCTEKIQKLNLKLEELNMGTITGYGNVIGKQNIVSIASPTSQTAILASDTTPDFIRLADELSEIRNRIGIAKEFGITIPQGMISRGKQVKNQLETFAKNEQEAKRKRLEAQLEEAESPKQRRERLQRELEALGESDDEI